MNLKKIIYNFLIWSERYTKTDMIYLSKGGFWLFLGQFFYSISAFLTSLAFANLLPKETYGAYRYILSFASILSIPTLSQINTAIVQAVARGYKGSFIPALKTRLRYGVFGGVIGLFIAGYYFLNGNATLTICFLIAAVFVPLMNSLNIYESLLDGEKKFNIRSRYRIIIQFISASVLIITLFLTKNIFLILLAYFVPYTLLYLIILQITIKKIRLNDKQDPKTISYGKHLSLMGIISSISSYFDRIVIWHYLGPASVAVYSFALSPPQQIGGVLKNIGVLALPKFSRHTKEELKSTLFSKILKLFLLIIILIGLYLILCPFLYRIFFPQYLDSIKYSQIFALSFMALSGAELLSISLTAQLKKKELYIARSVPPTIKIILFLVLIPLFGMWGAIYAVLITDFLKFGLYLFLFRKM